VSFVSPWLNCSALVFFAPTRFLFFVPFVPSW
jgi:hypothetical protein